ncbi:hypothetical protein D3C81_1897950 [compost metagenome]
MLRVQVSQGDIFHFPFDGRNPQTVGNRAENLQRFVGDSTLTLLRLVFERSHIVQSVRQFNDDHPNVLCHGDEHFAVVLVLLLLFGLEFNPLQLRQPVDEQSTIAAEMLLYLL